MKYKDWLDEWQENYVSPTLKQRTVTLYADVIRLHLAPSVGQEELETLSTRKLQSQVTRLIKDGLSTSTVNLAITIIKSSLKRAVSVGLIDVSPADGIVRPKKQEKNVECFSLEEQRKIIEEITRSENRRNLGIVVCLYTGVRIGELLALEWGDVDMKSRYISINKTRLESDGNITTCTPKTYSSNRIIPIPTGLIPIIKELKRDGAKTVISQDGLPVLTRTYQRAFESVLKRAGVERRGFHALRHTFATRAVECGMDVKTLAEVLGHKNPTVTLTRYVHSLESHKREMMNKLGKTL